MAETLAELIPAPKDQNMAWFCGEQLDMKTARGVSLGDMPPITPEDDTSQFGEARLIQLALFRFVGVENLSRSCFEIGAHDGITNSNTYRFRRELWRALLIEASENHLTRLYDNEQAGDEIVLATITPECLVQSALSPLSILIHTHIFADLDFGVIDIDGDDYPVWEQFTEYRPKLMLIEYNPKRPPDHEYNPTGANYMEQQAGLNPIVRLGESKGYVPIGRTFCNVLFLDRKYCDGSQPGHS